MTVTILVIQVLLPLALVAWLWFLPAGSLAGFALQAAGTGAFLFALARVAQWAVPVWWVPWVYGVLWLAGVMVQAPRRFLGDTPQLPTGARGWSGLAVSLLLLCLGVWFGGRAMAARSLPPGDVVDIESPFITGHFLVGHGGADVLVNAHLKTLDPTVPRFRPWRGQSRAVDFFGLGPLGLRARGWRPVDPSAYAIFGAALRAPCDGTVVAAEGSRPDLEVPRTDIENRLGNHVILRCGEVEIVLAHLQQGSVLVAPGDRVTVGDQLGKVGNSGASTEPHLHIHAQRPAPAGAPPISGDPLALRIGGRILVRGDRLVAGGERGGAR